MSIKSAAFVVAGLALSLLLSAGYSAPSRAKPPADATARVAKRAVKRASKRAAKRASKRAAKRKPTGERLLAFARELEGVPYDLGGRLRGDEGIDCQGIVFYAVERLHRCGWKSYSVMPTKTLARQELGAPVEGLAPVATPDIDFNRLKPGDVLFLLGDAENPNETSSAELALDPKRPAQKTPVWTWHMGIYAGDENVLHADPFRAGKVAEEPLRNLLESGGFVGIIATRIEGKPKPATCRHHRKMQRASAWAR